MTKEEQYAKAKQLYDKHSSYRKVAEKMKELYKVKVSFATIRNWHKTDWQVADSKITPPKLPSTSKASPKPKRKPRVKKKEVEEAKVEVVDDATGKQITKSSNAENWLSNNAGETEKVNIINIRVGIVMQQLLKGRQPKLIINDLAPKFGVCSRTIENYMQKARDIIAESTNDNIQEVMALAMAQLDMQLTKAIEREDHVMALQIWHMKYINLLRLPERQAKPVSETPEEMSIEALEEQARSMGIDPDEIAAEIAEQRVQ